MHIWYFHNTDTMQVVEILPHECWNIAVSATDGLKLFPNLLLFSILLITIDGVKCIDMYG